MAHTRPDRTNRLGTSVRLIRRPIVGLRCGATRLFGSLARARWLIVARLVVLIYLSHSIAASLRCLWLRSKIADRNCGQTTGLRRAGANRHFVGGLSVLDQSWIKF